MPGSDARPGLLFLVHRIPFPPNKGDKIRSFHLLRFLSAHYRVFLGAFIDAPEDRQYQDELDPWVEESFFVEINPRLRKLASLQGLFDGRPLTLPFYPREPMQGWVDRVLAERALERVVIFSSAMAQYVNQPRHHALRRVMDFIDVDSDKWRQYAARTAWPMRAIYAREADRLLAFERDVSVAFDASVFVSSHEAGLFARLSPAAADRIHAIPNGVDLAHYDPTLDMSSPYGAASAPLVFVGAMDYWPNVDAVCWFAEEVLPLVQAQCPTATFHVVGSRPDKRVQALAAQPGVEVTGRVEDVRPWIFHASLSVAPLRIARGIQNKVLESLAMARATVVTGAALEGIAAEPGVHVELQDEPQSMADAIVTLLEDAPRRRAMGDAGRALVEEAFDWDTNLGQFTGLLEEGGRDARPAA